MNVHGLSDSVVGELHTPAECAKCGSNVHVGHDLCVNCLLQSGLTRVSDEADSLDSALAEIDLRDADWKLGNYQIMEEIGRGGMGVIYRARQRHSRRIVALKRVLSYHADSRETLARFRREAEAAASLDHPNILPIYEVSEGEDGLPFFSMKFAPGGSLLDASVALRHDPRRIVALIAKVARAVQYAHGQGILHRDLKPGNVMLDARGEPLVSDFGLAKWLDTTSDLTRTLTIFGTPGYIAPEQARGPSAQLKPAADVYSLGAILFDLFTGHPPFMGAHALAVIQQAAEKSAPKLRTLAPTLDRDLETICARCLEREPQARYQSAGDLAEDLERWLEGRPIIARPVSPPTQLWRWARRNPVLATSILGCMVLAGTAVVELASSSRLGTIVHNEDAARHSIAIAPFEDLDSLMTTSPAARLTTRFILDGLGKQDGLRVESTTAQFPEDTEFWKPEDWKNIAARLGIRKIVTGTTRTLNGKRRVAFRIIDPASGLVIARKICEFTEFQNDNQRLIILLSRELRDAIENPDRKISEGSTANANPAAAEYLRAGKEYYYRYSPAETKTALQYFEKAIAADEGCAEAYAFFALASGWHFQQEPEDFSEEKQAKALAAATTAVRLSPELAVGYRALAALNSSIDIARSQEAALCALELEPGDVFPAGLIAYGWRMRGRPDLALRWFERSGRGQRPGMNAASIADSWTELGEDGLAEKAYNQHSEFWPDTPDAYVGLARLWMYHGDFARARQKSEEALKRYPDHVYSRQMLAIVKFFGRDYEAAESAYRKLVEIDPKGGARFYCCVSNLSALSWLKLRANAREEGERLAEEAIANATRELERAPRDREILYDLAGVNAAAGKLDEAWRRLDDAVKAGWIDYHSLNLDPRFDSIRAEPRFQAVLNELANKAADLKRTLPPEKFAANK